MTIFVAGSHPHSRSRSLVCLDLAQQVFQFGVFLAREKGFQ